MRSDDSILYTASFFLFFFSLVLAPKRSHAQQEYTRFQGQWRASDTAKKFFGDATSYQNSTGLNLGGISASAHTTLDCGRIDIVTNFEAQFAKIREQLAAFASKENIASYLRAAPFMYICHTQPQVCSILKHDSLFFAQNLNLRASACAAADKFINNQADKGRRELEAEAKRRCVENELSNPSNDMASATAACDRKTGLPLRDLSNYLNNVPGVASQRILKSVLSSVDENTSYPFLASVLGEIEVGNNGKWQPLWPKKMLKPHQIADNFIKTATDLVCYGLRTTLTSQPPPPISLQTTLAQTQQTLVREAVRRNLTLQDDEALQSLLEKDRWLACAALGRAIGGVAAKRTVATHNAALSSALTNDGVPDGIRNEYRARAQAAFEALEQSLEAEQLPDVASTKEQVRALAHYMRSYNRSSAARLSSARFTNMRERTEENSDCVDSATCQ